MRLIKMDDHSTGRSKETNAASQTLQFNYIRDTETTDVTAATSSSSSILSSQYLNIQRVPDLVSASKNFSNLLNSNELLVDTNGDLISNAALDRYIPQEYEGDLIHDDLTDDDRRLAAALVAVQLVNQQKQQSGTHILPLLTSSSLQMGAGQKLMSVAEANMVSLPPVSGPNKSVETSSASILLSSGDVSISSYNQTGTSQMQPPTLVHPLPPLKKVLSRSRYMQHEESTSGTSPIPLESLGIHTELGPMDIDPTGIKTPETIEFILPDDSKDTFDTEDSDVLDSDYDPSEYSRRHSLPHKKRIARRLRHPKKTMSSPVRSPRTAATSVGRPYQVDLTQTEDPTFTCELCFQVFTNQWKFFEHLKSHYEVTGTPLILDPSLSENKRFTSQFQLSKEVSIAVNGEPNRDSLQLMSRLRQSAPFAMPSPPRPPASPFRNNLPRLNPITVARTSPNGRAGEPLRLSSEFSLRPTTSSYRSTDMPVPSTSLMQTSEMTPSSSTVTLYQCQLCKRVFRRHKAFEVHMATIHSRPDPVEEFSEPEDMMEGIRVKVASDEEDTIPEMREVAVQKEWCDEEDLYATEEDLTAAELKAAEEDLKFQDEVVHTEADLGTLSVETETLPSSQYHEQTNEISANEMSSDVLTEIVVVEDAESIEARTCAMCDTTFPTREMANQHINMTHREVMAAITRGVRKNKPAKRRPKKGNLLCKECGRRFFHRNSLIYHLRSHIGDRAYHCETCSKSFFAKSALKVHMRQHTGAKPYKCEFCHKFFRQWGDLKYHVISIHSNQKNFQCEFCGKDFARKYSLTVHCRIHTGEKNYKCEYCDKSFRAASYLQNHRRVHTGEKPHKCEICEKMFRVRSDMKRHLLTHRDNYARVVKSVMDSPMSSCDSPDSKCVPESVSGSEVVQEQQLSLPDICKVEELEASTVEGILSAETVSASSRLQEINGDYGSREHIDGQREQGTVYFWQVFPTPV